MKTLRNECFSAASGGGTGRTLHPDNMAACPGPCGMTDTMVRMHPDAQFAGSSSVPARVEMMDLRSSGDSFHASREATSGNDPVADAAVAAAVAVEERKALRNKAF